MATCRICLKPTKDLNYHAECLESLFGTPRLPVLDIGLSKMMGLAAEMAGKMSISGVQEKVSLRLSDDKSRFEIAPTGGRYILKPEPSRFAFVPQNEHLTMRLAELVGIEVPAFGLVELKDKAIAYVIKRFDRLDDGTKLQVEDFCQLDEKPIRDKYQGSGELCVRILRKYATEPLIEIRKLYKLLLFSWWGLVSAGRAEDAVSGHHSAEHRATPVAGQFAGASSLCWFSTNQKAGRCGFLRKAGD